MQLHKIACIQTGCDGSAAPKTMLDVPERSTAPGVVMYGNWPRLAVGHSTRYRPGAKTTAHNSMSSAFALVALHFLIARVIASPHP